MNRLSHLGWRSLLACLALLCATMVLRPALAAGADAVPNISNTDQKSTEAYWTPQRLADAKPMVMPTLSSLPTAEPESTAPQPPVSSPGQGPTVRTAPLK